MCSVFLHISSIFSYRKNSQLPKSMAPWLSVMTGETVGGQAVTDVGFQMVLPEQDADPRGGSFKMMKKASQREQDLGGVLIQPFLEFSPLYYRVDDDPIWRAYFFKVFEITNQRYFVDRGVFLKETHLFGSWFWFVSPDFRIKTARVRFEFSNYRLHKVKHWN